MKRRLVWPLVILGVLGAGAAIAIARAEPAGSRDDRYRPPGSRKARSS